MSRPQLLDASAPERDPARFHASDVRRQADALRDQDLETADMLDELARRLEADERTVRGLPYRRWAQRCSCRSGRLLVLPSEQPTPICPSCGRAYGVIQ